MADSLQRSYRSFSGVDIQATFQGKRIGTLQGVSYTITREKAPQYVMGKVDPISFSRGKRGIAGSLIFLVFDRTNLLFELNNNFFSDEHDVNRTAFGNAEARRRADRTVDSVLGSIVGSQGATTEAQRDAGLVNALPWYHDQMPPMDIVLTAATEYGQVSRMMIHNIEILNAGSGISIDDITTDENMTFVATDITPWHSLQSGPLVDNGLDAGTLPLPTTQSVNG